MYLQLSFQRHGFKPETQLPGVQVVCVFRAVSKESQNRYSKSAKDWGWREFLQLHTLFDQEAGFLVSDSVVFAAEVLVLKEVSEVKQVLHVPQLMLLLTVCPCTGCQSIYQSYSLLTPLMCWGLVAVSKTAERMY